MSFNVYFLVSSNQSNCVDRIYAQLKSWVFNTDFPGKKPGSSTWEIIAGKEAMYVTRTNNKFIIS